MDPSKSQTNAHLTSHVSGGNQFANNTPTAPSTECPRVRVNSEYVRESQINEALD